MYVFAFLGPFISDMNERYLLHKLSYFYLINQQIYLLPVEPDGIVEPPRVIVEHADGIVEPAGGIVEAAGATVVAGGLVVSSVK